jgi:hypothetical protein
VLVSTPWVKFFFWIYLLFLVWASGTVTNPADPDLWHRLATGEYLCRTGHFPQGDTFSYLSDFQQIADHEWGGGIVFYALWQLGGSTAIVAAKLVSLALTLTLVIWAGLANRRPTGWITAFYALILLALLPSFQSTVRCMIFTDIFFALWVFWYQREHHGRPISPAFYVLSIILWANLHGGFVIGLVWLFLIAIVNVRDPTKMKKWAIRLVLCSLATLVNPFGWGLWVSVGRALVAPREGFDEWAPVAFYSDPMAYPGYKILFICVVAALGIQVYRKGLRHLDHAGLILIGAFMALAMTSARQTALFAIVVGALVPGIFPLKWPYDLRGHPLRRLGTVGLTGACLIVPFFAALQVMPGAGLSLEYPHVACPVDAVAFLQRENIRGNLLVPFNYGSYALWELRGRMRVSMDGRYDLVYLPKTYRRVDDFFSGRAGTDLLTNPVPDAVLVPRAAGAYPKLQHNPAWREAWHDPWNAVFLPTSDGRSSSDLTLNSLGG